MVNRSERPHHFATSQVLCLAIVDTSVFSLARPSVMNTSLTDAIGDIQLNCTANAFRVARPRP
jgi:hypothetical protein